MERDSIGKVEVPVDALWGATTARALGNFGREGITTVSDRPELLRALTQVKIAAARANADLGVLPVYIADSIVASGREILSGQWLDQFPLNLIQGGGGTATNMNLNEVLGSRATQLLAANGSDGMRVHPNDHVNRSQSTNDVYPTGLALATHAAGTRALADFDHLRSTFSERAGAFAGIQRLGRTCLRDALPVDAGATFRAYANALHRTTRSLSNALEQMRQVPLGGTAVGTGAGAPEGYRDRVIVYLSEEAGVQVEPAGDYHDSLANLDPLLAVAAALEQAMLVVAKVAQDLRFLYSGPMGGVGEIELPAVQAGSSMMPGKANPVLPEFVIQTSYEVRGARHTIECAVAAGELELNVMEPVIAKSLLGALSDAGQAARLFADLCISGVEWNLAVTERHLAGSMLGAVSAAATAGWDSQFDKSCDARQV
jgi:aspartate ammonia-lyase